MSAPESPAPIAAVQAAPVSLDRDATIGKACGRGSRGERREPCRLAVAGTPRPAAVPAACQSRRPLAWLQGMNTGLAER